MPKQRFAVCVLTLCFALLAQAVHAGQQGKLIFEDDFERNETQETRDEIGNGWGTNSKTRAAGNKQVDLKDGAMHIYLHEVADHAVSVTHAAEFRDGSVELRFMLEDKKDSLGLNFADLKYKAVHAGHLFVAKISTKDVHLLDLKTGNMDQKIRELRQAKKLSAAQQAMLKTKAKKVPHRLEPGKWYRLVVEITGDTLAVSIDGQHVSSLSSVGIAHPTKRTLRLSVPRNAVVDDVKIYSRGATSNGE